MRRMFIGEVFFYLPVLVWWMIRKLWKHREKHLESTHWVQKDWIVHFSHLHREQSELRENLLGFGKEPAMGEAADIAILAMFSVFSARKKEAQ